MTLYNLIWIILSVSNYTFATLVPTLDPTTSSPSIYPTIENTPTTATKPEYAAGINGYVDRGQDWVNEDASQIELMIICGAFALCLVLCLCAFYCYQSRKTKKLTKMLYSFDPELLQVTYIVSISLHFVLVYCIYIQ